MLQSVCCPRAFGQLNCPLLLLPLLVVMLRAAQLLELLVVMVHL
jgi:hypothetical protein